MTATVLTTLGKQRIVDLIDGTATESEFWVGWGTGGSSTGATATDADIKLAAAATESFATAVISQPNATENQFVGTLTAGSSKTVEEMILAFCSDTSNATGAIIRASHGGVALATGDSIQYTVLLTQQ